MLVDFTIKNFGPFRDRHTFSMQATGVGGHPEMIIGEDSAKKGLLSSSFIFGANASGKSYLVKSLIALKYMMSDAFEEGFMYGCYEPFRLQKNSSESPVEMNIRLLISGELYDYSISYGRDSIARESLYRYPNGRRACVFDRTGPREFKKSKKTLEKLTSSSSSYLVVASKYNDSECLAVRQAIRNIITISGWNDLLVIASCKAATINPSIRNGMLDGLKMADFGISDFVYSEHELETGEFDLCSNDVVVREKKGITVDIEVKHDFKKYDVSDDELLFPLDVESSGTRCMMGLMGPLFDALSHGKTIVVDEFGSYLHPLLVDWIVGQFSEGRNPNGAQFIAVTHCTDLLDLDRLRKDQIWFVEKDRDDGSSKLYSLYDFNGIRKNADIRKSYLFGRYDAVPAIIPRGVVG